MSNQIMGMLSGVFHLLELALIIRVLLSWFPHDPHHPLLSILYQVTDPLLRPFRGLVPLGGIDLSPIFAFIMLGIIQKVLFRLIGGY